MAGLRGGHARVSAICDWVREHVQYRIGSTTATSTARDVFVQRCGVCRDMAHLAITFCRALNIPARLVSGYAAFPDPPPDFHAVIEAYLGGRWVLFDPSGMAPVEQLVRLATGPDAKDVAFATIFGPARMVAMSPELGRHGRCRSACGDARIGAGAVATTRPGDALRAALQAATSQPSLPTHAPSLTFQRQTLSTARFPRCFAPRSHRRPCARSRPTLSKTARSFATA